MIILYALPPSFGLPDPSPFVIKTEVQLQMAGLPYRRQLGGRPNAPKGKLPYIDDDGRIIADSTFIRFHIESVHRVDLDQGWDEEARAQAWAIERLTEDHIYWAMVHSRWAIDSNFEKGPAHFYDHLPPGEQEDARARQRAAVLGYLQAQGFGRHSPQEVGALAARDFAALSRLLGEKPYILGERPCGADASVFGQIASALTPWFDSPVRRAAESYDNLVAYSSRMMATHYPDFA